MKFPGSRAPVRSRRSENGTLFAPDGFQVSRFSGSLASASARMMASRVSLPSNENTCVIRSSVAAAAASIGDASGSRLAMVTHTKYRSISVEVGGHSTPDVERYRPRRVRSVVAGDVVGVMDPSVEEETTQAPAVGGPVFTSIEQQQSVPITDVRVLRCAKAANRNIMLIIFTSIGADALAAMAPDYHGPESVSDEVREGEKPATRGERTVRRSSPNPSSHDGRLLDWKVVGESPRSGRRATPRSRRSIELRTRHPPSVGECVPGPVIVAVGIGLLIVVAASPATAVHLVGDRIGGPTSSTGIPVDDWVDTVDHGGPVEACVAVGPGFGATGIPGAPRRLQPSIGPGVDGRDLAGSERNASADHGRRETDRPSRWPLSS